MHIDRKALAFEMEKLSTIIRDRKDILIGTKNIFPDIEVLEVFENWNDIVDQSEYEEDFEEEGKRISRQNTVRTESQQNSGILVGNI